MEELRRKIELWRTNHDEVVEHTYVRWYNMWIDSYRVVTMNAGDPHAYDWYEQMLAVLMEVFADGISMDELNKVYAEITPRDILGEDLRIWDKQFQIFSSFTLMTIMEAAFFSLYRWLTQEIWSRK